MKYYSAIKKNALESVPKRYMNLAHDIKVTILMICVQYSSVKYTHIAAQQVSRTFVLQHQNSTPTKYLFPFPHIDNHVCTSCFYDFNYFILLYFILVES